MRHQLRVLRQLIQRQSGQGKNQRIIDPGEAVTVAVDINKNGAEYKRRDGYSVTQHQRVQPLPVLVVHQNANGDRCQ